MIRNIIFDWSGTLVDDLGAVWRATNHVFRRAGLPELTLERFRAEFTLPFTGFYERYTPHIPLPKLEEWFHGHYRTIQETICELPHARAFLQWCRDRGIRTFLLSTIHRDHFATQAAATGFEAFLDRAYIEILDKRTKILELLAENGLKAGETLFIGDMQHDVETAKHGGVFSCAVLTGYTGLDQLRASEPDVIVEHLGELQRILERGAWELTPAAQSGAEITATRRQPTVTVGGLIFNPADQVLMIRTNKWSNKWGIPGGKIRFAEPSLDALRREIKEETNLDVQDVRFVVAQDCIHSREFYRDEHFILLNYTCACDGTQEVVLNDEAQEYQWITLTDALDLNLNQPTRTLICEVLRMKSQPL